MRLPFPRHRSRRSGFTLVEMLVAMAVLAILVLLINQLFSTASQTMSLSSKQMSADAEARVLFNRMAEDFAGLLRRSDVDLIFYKGAGNDALFFYSQSTGYFGAAQSTPAESPISLVGYRIDGTATDSAYLQLERLALGLTWDNGQASATPATGYGAISYLFWDPSQGFSSANAAKTLLPGAWPSAIGAAPYQIASDLNTNLTAPYEVVGDQVFRLEMTFLLKDGSYSDIPIENPTSPLSNTTATTPPTTSSDSSQKYVPGSRWYNTSTGEAFVCADATTGAAVWTGAGVQDISAVIVTVAILDANSRKLMGATAASQKTMVATIASKLPDSALGTPGPPASGTLAPGLPAAAWNTVITNPGFAASLSLPAEAASQVRVYQRFFYLN